MNEKFVGFEERSPSKSRSRCRGFCWLRLRYPWRLTSAITAGNLILTFAAVGVAVPIFEKLLFRGLVYNELRKVARVRGAIVIQAVLFGLYHMNLVQGAYALLIGLALGYVYHKSRSIIAPMLLQVSINCTSILFTQDQVSSTLNKQLVTVLAAFVIVRHKRSTEANSLTMV